MANGCLFGGYADQPWSSPNTWTGVSSSAAFLFSLQSPAGSPPLKMPIAADKARHALRQHAGYGPLFGGGPDLSISHNANINHTSCCSAQSYTGHVANLMAGSLYFTPDDVEVFAVVYEA